MTDWFPDNDPNVTCGLTDEQIQKNFELAIEQENERKLALGCPIQGVDPKTGKPCLVYPEDLGRNV